MNGGSQVGCWVNIGCTLAGLGPLGMNVEEEVSCRSRRTFETLISGHDYIQNVFFNYINVFFISRRTKGELRQEELEAACDTMLWVRGRTEGNWGVVCQELGEGSGGIRGRSGYRSDDAV